jgi:hypothetical protein
MTLVIQILAWDRHKNVAGLNSLMRSHPSPLDNWIYNSNTYINKGKKNCNCNTYTYINKQQKTCTDLLPLNKNHILSQK